MLSHTETINVITNKITNDKPIIATLIGTWGTGKTHAFREAEKNSGKKILYVSIFGLNSIQDINNSLIANKIEGNLSSNDKIPGFIKNYFPELSGIFSAFKSNSKFTEKITDLVLANKILTEDTICIDDIERRGKGITIQDLLGYAWKLKEVNKCKVFLLINEEKSEEINIFKENKEKVIDYEIHLTPTPHESVNIASKKHGEEFIDTIKNCAAILSVTNIRTILKFYVTLEKVLNIITPKHSATTEIVIKSVFLLTAINSTNNDSIPTKEYLYDYINGIRSGKENQKWNTLLDKYGLKILRINLIEAMAECIRDLFSDKSMEKILLATKEIDDNLTVSLNYKIKRDLYDEIDNNFNLSIDEVYRSINSKIIQCDLKFNYDEFLSLINRANNHDGIDYLIEAVEHLILKNDNYITLEDSIKINLSDNLMEVVPKIIKQHESIETKNLSIDEAINTINEAALDANLGHKLALINPTQHDLVKLLKSIKGENFSTYIRIFLGLIELNWENNESIKSFDKNLRLALFSIAKESPLNNYRVSKFIKIEELKSPPPDHPPDIP